MMDNSIFPMLDAKRPNIGEQLYEHFLYNMMTGTITGHVGEITGELNIPDEIHGIEIRTIGTGAFTGCTGITSLKIGNGCIFRLQQYQAADASRQPKIYRNSCIHGLHKPK